ncbi:vanadium-dependent haloperoxidase [Arenibacter sp. GZD96]|uniref:vanadium-dependent haloperoxidase n=1 Tax=Aurantibrevibacter litoralis TaxID=3106030 RepID=UPI002AFF9C0D|nr:vanadium-dependent haloperoxidase [Arenibacter sp. GZD-96]MEA1786416.1 vanadium-dependent haloperoxidase [Arenibacter sp. GZD-96]
MKNNNAIWSPKLLFGLLSVLLVVRCSVPEIKDYTPQDVALEWAKMALYITQHTPQNSPPYSARGFGYIGYTMYESVVHSSPKHQSVAGELNDLQKLPEPEAGAPYDWVISLNAGQASILKNIYNQTSDDNKAKIDSLEQLFNTYFSNKINDDEIFNRSVAYGKSIANTIFEWSKTDGGHRAYLKNYDKEALFTEKPGSWKPPLYSQSISHVPLLHEWGNNRTFLKANREMPTPYMIPYDTVPGSPYYEEFMEVYKTDLVLTQEQKETAIWWGDDPDVSFTPSGHSYYIATIALDQTRPSLIDCAETYAKVGMAVADAVLKCWEWKYHYFSERPNTFIPQFIDPDWVSFWPDPPFPAFPSAHAVQAAAAAVVLEDMLGNPFHFTDNAHLGRERDEVRDVDFVPRSFNTFWDAAQETADSRLYGGIHTPQDNIVGLEEGKKVAENINSLQWKNE